MSTTQKTGYETIPEIERRGPDGEIVRIRAYSFPSATDAPPFDDGLGPLPLRRQRRIEEKAPGWPDLDDL